MPIDVPRSLIHSTAVIGCGVRLGVDVRIGPYAVVGDDVHLGDGVRIGAHSVVGDRVRIGAGCRMGEHAILRPGTHLGVAVRVDSFAVVGGDPQDLTFDPATPSGVRIHDGAVLREGVTVHRASVVDGYTEIGAGAMLMAGSHVAHDARIGTASVLGNNVMLGGHVHIGAHAFLGGGAGIHQHVRLGDSVMIGGNASISYDVPPYTLVADRNTLRGLNRVGLRRRQLDREALADLKACYRAVYGGPGDLRAHAQAALATGGCGTTACGYSFLGFFAEGRRGFVRPRHNGNGQPAPTA